MTGTNAGGPSGAERADGAIAASHAITASQLSGRPLAGTVTSGNQTLTWEISGAKRPPSQKGMLAGSSGVIAPGKTLTVRGTLTMTAPPTPGIDGWEDLWQGAWLKGSWINVKSWKPVKKERHVPSIGPGTYAYPYTVKLKIPKKVPKKAISNAKLRKGPLVPGEVLITLFTGACINACDPDALTPHNDWDEVYITVSVLKKA